MRHSFRLLALDATVVAFVTLARIATADAATLYVDGTIASASCSTYDPATRSCGSGAATAYRTLDATFPIAVAADTVLVRAGEYAEGERVGPANSGYAGAPITFRAYGAEAVHIRGTLDARGAASTTSSPFDLSNRSFIDIDGLEISHYGLCIRLDHASDIEIRNMQIHDCGQGIWITNDSARVVISDLVSSHNSFRDGGASVNIHGATDVRVERASATMNSGDPAVGAVEGDGFHAEVARAANITFIDCIANDNEDDGFDLTASNVRVERSVAARNTVGFKLWDEHCDPAGCPPSPAMNRYVLINVSSWANTETGLFAQNGPDLEIYNSVFANNVFEGIRLVQNRAALPDPVATAVMQNDIVVANGSWGRRFDSAGADNTDWNLTSDHNVFFANGNGNAVWSGEDSSTLTSDPGLNTPTSGDFHLRAGGPAIDSGRDLSSVFSDDMDGARRPAGAAWDRGIYEFGAVAPVDGGVADASSDAGPMADSGARSDSGGADAHGDATGGDASRDAGVGPLRAGCACRATKTRSRTASDLGMFVLCAAAVRRRRRGREEATGRSWQVARLLALPRFAARVRRASLALM